jgi:hypothetical protein
MRWGTPDSRGHGIGLVTNFALAHAQQRPSCAFRESDIRAPHGEGITYLGEEMMKVLRAQWEGKIVELEHPTIPDATGFADRSRVEQLRYLQALWDRNAKQTAELRAPRIPSGAR